MLTRKQHELFVFIQSRVAEGISPSFEEMRDALQLKSKSGIHRLVLALEERGFIRRLPHRARALEVLRSAEEPKRLAEISVPVSAPTSVGGTMTSAPFRLRTVSGGGNGASPIGRSEADLAAGRVTRLPLLGRIAAGNPIDAVRSERSLDVPATMLGRGEHFALEVVGDSMIDAGILDGDTVLIQRCDVVENGTIVVAIVDQEEVTLKRWRRRGDSNSVALEPANPAYEPRVFGLDRVNVQGRLTGLLRRY